MKNLLKKLQKKLKWLSLPPNLPPFWIRWLSLILSRCSDRQTRWISRGFAGFIYFIYRLSPYRNFIFQNIQTAFNWEPQKAHALAYAHVQNLFYALFQFLRLGAKTLPEVTLEGEEYLLAAYQKERGVILASAHFGLWELIPILVAQKGWPMHVLVQQPTTGAFDKMFTYYRKLWGVETHYNTSLSGLRPLLRALKRAEVVGLLIDQHGESEALMGQFFGQKVSLPEGVDFFSRVNHSPIVPVYVFPRGDGYCVRFFPSVSEGEQTMQRIYAHLEDQIRSCPEAWLWSYNRWDKYTP